MAPSRESCPGKLVSRPIKLICGLILVALALAAWRFRPPRSTPPLAEAPQPAAEPVSASGPPIDGVRPIPGLSVRARPATGQTESAQSQSPVSDSGVLNEQLLVGTKWARDGFGLEFASNGKLLIGGRERAQWRVEGSRIRLYRDTTGEEHWLEMVGGKLMWEGKEISRVR